MTWTVSMVPTAAQMNAEIRDHLVWLKAALDLITGATAADSGTGTKLRITRPTANDTSFDMLVTGDTLARGAFDAAGAWYLGSGASGADLKFARISAAQLMLSSAGQALNTRLTVSSPVGNNASFGLYITGDATPRILMDVDSTGMSRITFGGDGTTRDIDLYRGGAGELKTSDRFYGADGLTTKVVAGAVGDGSFATVPPSGTIAIDTTNSRIYVRVGTTWKSVVVA